MQFFSIALQLDFEFNIAMDKTIKDILTDLNSDIKLKNEENLLEIEKKFSL